MERGMGVKVGATQLGVFGSASSTRGGLDLAVRDAVSPPAKINPLARAFVPLVGLKRQAKSSGQWSRAFQ
jgi:hypothetical protein